VLFNVTMLQHFIGMRSVDGVYWTLGYELLFYGLALGLFIVGLLRRAELVSAGALLLSIAYSLALQAGVFAAFGPAGHLVKAGLILLLIFQNVQYFVTGMLLHRCWKEGVTASRVALIALSVVTTLIVDSRFMAEMQTLLIVVMAVAISGKAGVLRSGPLVFLGSISYTLYLTHQDAGYVMIHALETRGASANLAIPVTILTAVAIASLMTALVEQPAMALIRGRYKAFMARRATRVRMPAALPAD
jgi:peptidoglycan/LPS O-acetylase OafA/YrhL